MTKLKHHKHEKMENPDFKPLSLTPISMELTNGITIT